MSDDPWVEAMLDNSGKEFIGRAPRKKRSGSNNEWKYRNSDRFKAYTAVWRSDKYAKYPFYYVLKHLKEKASKTGVEFDLDYRDWTTIPERCSISGVPVIFGATGPRRKNTMVFDRVDANKGWVKGNVRIVAWQYSAEYRNKLLERRNKCSS